LASTVSADAAAFLAQVEQDAAAFLGDALQRAFELGAAVAALREHHVAGQAFGVHPRQHRLAGRQVAQSHRQVFLAGGRLDPGVQRELGPRRRQRARGGIVQQGRRGEGGGGLHDGVSNRCTYSRQVYRKSGMAVRNHPLFAGPGRRLRQEAESAWRTVELRG